MDNKKMIKSMIADGTISRTSKYYFSQGFEPFKEMLEQNAGRPVHVFGYYKDKKIDSNRELTLVENGNSIVINGVSLDIEDVWDIRARDDIGMCFEIFTYGERDKFYIVLAEPQLAAKSYKDVFCVKTR